jgi:GAF domain-containing protein
VRLLAPGTNACMDKQCLESALDRLSTLLDESDDLLGYLRAIARFAVLEVPGCVGLSITIYDDEGVPYTVLASDPQAQRIDAMQYLSDGPCVDTLDEGRPTDVPDILDERRWAEYARTAAAVGVRSSLSLPMLYENEIVGALNLYGGTPNTFDDSAHLLAELVSGHAALAIHNADLSMRTSELAADTERDLARTSEERLELAVQVMLRTDGVTDVSAREQIRSAAARAGIAVSAVVESIIALDETGPRRR